MAGRPFSLTSPVDVAKVLYIELKLPTDDSKAGGSNKITSIRGGRLPKGMSTAKDKLEKLVVLHPLPAVVLEHRRLSFSVSKCVAPLNELKEENARVAMFRLHGETIFHTVSSVADEICCVELEFELFAHIVC